MKPLDRMHMALGEFLTEIGRLEFRMLLLGVMISEPDVEWFFEGYAKLTFGPKIDWLKDRWTESGMLDKYKAQLDSIYADMDVLLKKRNYLTHGETYEASFKGRPMAPYRVGVTKKNVDYLDDFERAQHGDNVFTIAQVKEATALCVKIRKDLEAIQQDISDNAMPYEEAVRLGLVAKPDDTPWPDSKA